MALRQEVTQYVVSAVPESIRETAWDITVEYRGDGRWAVKHLSRCLSADGTWDYEPIPSEREDGWLADHRFDLDTALTLARHAAPEVVVNGFTPAGVMAFHASHADG